MSMKTLKILDRVHYELKIFAAKNNESISDIAANAIIRELTERGHKFSSFKTRPTKLVNKKSH